MSTTHGEKSVSSAPDDLPEFEDFLAQIGQGHWHRPSIDVQVQGAEPATPVDASRGTETEPVAAGRPGRMSWIAAGAGTLLLLCLLVAWGPLRHLAQAKTEPGQQYVCSPFFSPESFAAVQAGMSAGEVRDLVGYPLARRTDRDTAEWIYTAPGKKPDGRFPLYSVLLKAGRVVAAKEVDAAVREDLAAVSRTPVQLTGIVQLIGDDGESHMLPWTERTPWVLAGPETSDDALPTNASSARVHAPSVRSEPEPESHVVVAVGKGRLQVPALSVYCAGMLYALPVQWGRAAPGVMKDDVEWLLARLR